MRNASLLIHDEHDFSNENYLTKLDVNELLMEFDRVLAISNQPPFLSVEESLRSDNFVKSNKFLVNDFDSCIDRSTATTIYF